MYIILDFGEKKAGSSIFGMVSLSWHLAADTEGTTGKNPSLPTSDPVRRQAGNPQTPAEESPRERVGHRKTVSRVSLEETHHRESDKGAGASRGRARGTDRSLKQGKCASLDF